MPPPASSSQPLDSPAPEIPAGHWRLLAPALAALLIAAFVLFGLHGLGTLPAAHEDEAWLAAPGYGLWTAGAFATDLFRGFFGMERHYYGFMPFVPLLLGGSLEIFGMGLWQARLVPLLLATLTLLLTYRAGVKLATPGHGLLAVAILALWPVARPTEYFLTGIPLLDFARYARNDIAVPPCGLAALLLLAPPLCRGELPGARRSLGIGLLVGLGMLGHVYAGFWLVPFVLAAFWTCGRRAWRFALGSTAGALAALFPWAAFAASAWEDYRLQNLHYGERFALFDPRFYLRNLLEERERFRPLLDSLPGSLSAWLWIAGLAAGTVLLVRRARSRPAARLLLLLPWGMAALFALLLVPKSFTYTATLWPLFALVVSTAIVAGWQAARGREAHGSTAHGQAGLGQANRGRAARGWTARVLLVLLLCVPLAGGLGAGRGLLERIARATPYREYMARVAERLPAGRRVMGLPQYWFGLVEKLPDYRTILVPVLLTDPRYTPRPVTFGEAADAYPPELLLLDPAMRKFITRSRDPGHRFHELGAQIETYLERRQARLFGELDDPTYGRLEILELAPLPGGGAGDS